MFRGLDDIQINILLASIMGDGKLTKLYKYSRRKNSNYREDYGEKQKKYREWKAEFMDGLLYIRPKSQSLISASSPLFTNLLHLFYNSDGNKIIPPSLLPYCKLPHFLAVLYMDDGTLSITSRVNSNNKKIYLTPQIYLYLQNFTPEDLVLLKNHINETFHINFHVGKSPDGNDTILRTTCVSETFDFLYKIKDASIGCPSMYYKTNWDYRLRQESVKWRKNYPDYQLVTSSSERFKNYSNEEMEKLLFLKKNGHTDKKIAKSLGKSYWSVVYKLRELRKLNQI